MSNHVLRLNGVLFVVVLGLVLGMPEQAFGLTGVGESAVGPLETVTPEFSALAADISQATPGVTVTITFSVSETLLANPLVTVNGNVADFVSESGGNYTYEYQVDAGDINGMARVQVGGIDTLGNAGSLSDSTFLEIAGATDLPLHWWPVVVALLTVGTVLLTLRQRKGAALLALLLLAAPVAFAQAPTVSNVAFTQGPDGAGGTQVDITYDLNAPNGPCDIWVSLSKDGGADGFPFAVTSVTGDVANVSTGTGHLIVWDIAADCPGESIPQAQIRLIADDGPDVPEMISVGAGSFDMGRTSAGDDATFGDSNELPVHTVTLSAYEIGKFEVTNQQVADVFNWAHYNGRLTTVDATTATAYGQELLDLDSMHCHIQYSGGIFSPETRTGLPGTTTYSMADHPVLDFSWHGAVAYCNWLSEIAGLTPVYDTSTWTANLANDGYRLPTEAQWERAAAWDGSKHWIYSFLSDTLTGKDRCNYSDNDPDYVNPLGLTEQPYTSPVGWFDGVNVSPNGSIPTVNSPSPVGCYDMSGNVWEWCHDRYDSAYYASSPASDPEGPSSGSLRVLRGGAWNPSGFRCRSAIRIGVSPDMVGPSTGLRVARTP